MKNIKDYPIINQLPNPFQREDGSFITTVSEWQEQKVYYKKLLQEVLYGSMPEKVKYESFACVKKEDCFEGRAIYEEIVIYLSEDKKYSFPAKIYYPKAEGQYPFIVWNYGSERDKCPILEEAVCERRFGVAMFSRDDLAVDDTEKRMLDILYPECTWGKLAQWAWGHSRVMDYLDTTSYALPNQYIVTGHSRGGKASLCAGIYDERAAVVHANNSGCGGAGCTRFGGGRYGYKIGRYERIENIMSIFPQWFGPGLAPFAEAGEEGEMRFPVDSHIMRAVVAPRVMFSTEGCADTWSNPYGTLVAWRAAQEVFHFHGCNNHNLIHYREGGHSFSKVDWNALLDCFDMIFRKKPVESKLIYFDDAWYKKEGKPDWMADRLHYVWEAPTGKCTYFHAYKKAAYEELSKDFRLTVEGQEVEAADYFEGRYSYAHIAYEGTASFEITALGGEITSYDVSPHSYNIVSRVAGDTLSFELTQTGSRYLVIEITAGGRKNMLVIAADPKIDLKKPVADGQKVVDITLPPYNGDRTGVTDMSAILQQAIDDMSAAGGGTVYVPAGVYQFVYLDAKDNVTLYLDEGACLRGSEDRDAYIWRPGINGKNSRCNIDLKDAKNFSILGEGVIDANALALVEPDSNGNKTGWCNYRKGIITGNGAKNILLEGITVKDATGWTFSIQDTEHIVCRNMKMLNDYDFVHSDGYDFLSCRGVLVEECLGVCGDDVFCPKANREDREMRDYLFKNSVAFASGGAGCKVGMQAKSKTCNIEFNNIDVIRGYRGITVAHDDGSGDFDDIRFIDVRTEKFYIHDPEETGQFRPAPFVIWTMSKNNNGATVSNVEVTNCSFANYGSLKGLIQGCSEDSQVKGVKFTNLIMNGTLITEENYSDFIIHGENISDIEYHVTDAAKEE